MIYVQICGEFYLLFGTHAPKQCNFLEWMRDFDKLIVQREVTVCLMF